MVLLRLHARLCLVLDERIVVCDVFVLDFPRLWVNMLHHTFQYVVFLLLMADRCPIQSLTDPLTAPN